MDCTLKELLTEFSQQRYLSDKFIRVYLLVGKKKTKFVMSGYVSVLFKSLSEDYLNFSVVDVYQGFYQRKCEFFRYLGITVKEKQGIAPPAPDDD